MPPLSTTGEFTTLVSEGPLILLRPSPLPGIPPDAKKISCMRRRLALLGSTSPSNRQGAYRGGMAGRCHVVVLNWNGRDSIRPCLQSVLHQTYPSYRVVVVDNASTDGSRDVVRDEFPEVIFVPLLENLHFARGTNAGLREALRAPECGFIATLNNDTRDGPEGQAEPVPTAGPRVGLVASKLVFAHRPEGQH